MAIHESAEDYLEAILKLREAHGNVRSIDVVGELHFSKPSVSVAMKKLRESGHVEMDENGLLTLTPAGEAIAQRIYERHKVLTVMLTSLGVEEPIAAKEACKIEHDISVETFEKIKQHLKDNGVLD
ncbi:MAG: metal-dependent transcriptional regulator [Candidatus Avoscillospira sp.]